MSQRTLERASASMSLLDHLLTPPHTTALIDYHLATTSTSPLTLLHTLTSFLTTTRSAAALEGVLHLLTTRASLDVRAYLDVDVLLLFTEHAATLPEARAVLAFLLKSPEASVELLSAFAAALSPSQTFCADVLPHLPDDLAAATCTQLVGDLLARSDDPLELSAVAQLVPDLLQRAGSPTAVRVFEYLATRPHSAELFQLACSILPTLVDAESTPPTLVEFYTELAFSAVQLGNPQLTVKQGLWLLQTLFSTPAFLEHDLLRHYSLDMWTTYHTLLSTVYNAPTHFYYEDWPHVSILYGADASMDRWLQVLLHYSFSNGMPPIRKVAFDAVFNAPGIFPHLSTDFVAGPMLECLSHKGLYRDTRTSSEEYASFGDRIIAFIKAWFAVVPDPSLVSKALRTIASQDTTTIVQLYLAHTFDALTQLPVAATLGDADLEVMATWMRKFSTGGVSQTYAVVCTGLLVTVSRQLDVDAVSVQAIANFLASTPPSVSTDSFCAHVGRPEFGEALNEWCREYLARDTASEFADIGTEDAITKAFALLEPSSAAQEHLVLQLWDVARMLPTHPYSRGTPAAASVVRMLCAMLSVDATPHKPCLEVHGAPLLGHLVAEPSPAGVRLIQRLSRHVSAAQHIPVAHQLVLDATAARDPIALSNALRLLAALLAGGVPAACTVDLATLLQTVSNARLAHRPPADSPLSATEWRDLCQSITSARWRALDFLAPHVPTELALALLAECSDGFDVVAKPIDFEHVLSACFSCLNTLQRDNYTDVDVDVVANILRNVPKALSDLDVGQRGLRSEALNVTLHPFLFGLPALQQHIFDTLSKQLLDAVDRRHTVLLDAALHAVKNWLLNPDVAADLYVGLIVQLSCVCSRDPDMLAGVLRGKLRFWQELVLGVVEPAHSNMHVPVPAGVNRDDLEAHVNAAIDIMHPHSSPHVREFHTHFSHSRITHASLVRLIMLTFVEVIPERAEAQPETAAAMARLVRNLVAHILECLASKSHFPKKTLSNAFSGATLEAAYMLQLLAVLTQTLPMLQRVLGDEEYRAFHDDWLGRMWPLYDRFQKNNAVRSQWEYALTMLYVHAPDDAAFSLLLDKLREYSNLRAHAITTDLLVAGFVMLYLPAERRNALFPGFLEVSYPWLLSNYGFIRMSAQYFYFRLIELCRPELALGSAAAQDTDSDDTRALRAMIDYLLRNSDSTRARARLDAFFVLHNPRSRCTVSGIFADSTLDKVFLTPATSKLLKDMVSNMLKGLRADSMAYDEHSFSPFETHQAILPSHSGIDQDISTTVWEPPADAAAPEQATPDEEQAKPSALTEYQQKIQPFHELFAHVLEDPNAEDESRRVTLNDKTLRKRHDIIVVASLIDKLPNLAGLSRTCEIFNASKLVVNDLSMTKETMFGRISVTAEKWLPFEEVREADVGAYLADKRREGYRVIALEQTANSTDLTRFTFPEKVVLLLGREREGTPVELLNLVDECVEIPQFGLIRSLNVHVSASIMVWEYTRQLLMSGE